METEGGAEGWRQLVLMAPPPGSFGLQTPELFLPGSLSLGQKSSEALFPTPTLQPLGLEDFSVFDPEPG